MMAAQGEEQAPIEIFFRGKRANGCAAILRQWPARALQQQAHLWRQWERGWSLVSHM